MVVLNAILCMKCDPIKILYDQYGTLMLHSIRAFMFALAN